MLSPFIYSFPSSYALHIFVPSQVEVESDIEVLKTKYPLMAAVNRAASRKKACLFYSRFALMGEGR